MTDFQYAILGLMLGLAIGSLVYYTYWLGYKEAMKKANEIIKDVNKKATGQA